MPLHINSSTDVIPLQRTLGIASDDFLAAVQRLSSTLAGDLSSHEPETSAPVVHRTPTPARAEDSLSGMASILQHMRVLALRAAAANLSTQDRILAQGEFERLLGELDQLSHEGDSSPAGAAGDEVQALAGEMQTLNRQALGLRSVQLTTPDHAENSVARLDVAMQQVSVTQTTLLSAVNPVAEPILQTGDARIRDTSRAEKIVQLTRDKIVDRSGESLTAQANQTLGALLGLLQ